MSAPRDHDGNMLDVDRRVERAIARVQCSACRTPKALGLCRHIIATDGRVIMAKAEWARLVDELNTLRTFAAQAADMLEGQHE